MDFFNISKKGERELNEDSSAIYEYDERIVFVVADGLGGHGYGNVASNIAINSVKSIFDKGNKRNTEELLREAFESTQADLIEVQKKNNNFSSYKTTLVILVIDKDYVQWGYIGDSRLYYFNSNKLIKRTLDHSVPQMLVLSGEIKERQIRNHVDRNKLLRVMGVSTDSPKYVIEKRIERQSEQAYLLCSDGFWEFVKEKQMVRFLKKADCCKKWIELMEQYLLKKGTGHNMDNYSAIAVIV